MYVVGFQVLMGSICVDCHEHKCYPIKNQVENRGIIGSYNKKKNLLRTREWVYVQSSQCQLGSVVVTKSCISYNQSHSQRQPKEKTNNLHIAGRQRAKPSYANGKSKKTVTASGREKINGLERKGQHEILFSSFNRPLPTDLVELILVRVFALCWPQCLPNFPLGL